MLDLRRALGVERDAADGVEVMVIEHGDVKLGLAIDSFIGERQIVQRSLGKFLAGIRLVSGIGLIEAGAIVLLLSVPELVWRWSEGDTDLARTLPLDTRRRTEWTVLVVDDSELTRDMLVGLTRRAGLAVTEAVNGRDALAKARAAPPDLILTDLDMPVMDGLELIAALRGDEALRDIPVVVLTTRGSDEDKRRALSAGADSFIVKHEFDEASLNQTIGHFLDVRAR
jgi:CheY-like chemotaxis protein